MDSTGGAMNEDLRLSMEPPTASEIPFLLRSTEIEAAKGTIQTLQPPCQFTQQLRSGIQQMVKDEMEKANQKLLGAIALQVTQLMTVIPVVVKDEMEKAIMKMAEEVQKNLSHNPCSRLFPHHAKSSASRSLKLLFMGPLPDSLLTLQKIETQVELCDYSGNRVEDISPEPPIMIEILALNGGFEVDDIDWTAQDFDDNVAHRRKGKGDLLNGKCKILMTKGVANVNGIAFTDNSTRYGTFRLGARVRRGLPNGVEVRDAVSKPIRVKDRRGGYYKTHNTLDDNVSSLRHIGPVRSKMLAEAKIYTVNDLLKLYYTDENKLKSTLRFPEDQWSQLIQDAKSYKITRARYQYHGEAAGVDPQLNSAFDIDKVTFKSGNSLPYSSLTNAQKVKKISLIAYEKQTKRSNTSPSTLTSMQAESLSTVDSPKSVDPLSLNLKTPCLISPSSDPQTNKQHQDAAAVDTTTMMTVTTPPCGSPTFGEKREGHPTPYQADQGGQEELLSLSDQTAQLLSSIEECLTVDALASHESQESPSLNLQASEAAPCQPYTASIPQTYMQHLDAPAAEKATTILSVNPTTVEEGRGPEICNNIPNQTDEGGQISYSQLGLPLSPADLNLDYHGQYDLEFLNDLIVDNANEAEDLISQGDVGWGSWDTDQGSWDTDQITLDTVNGIQAVVSANVAEEPMSQSDVESKRRRIS